MPEQMKWWIL